MRRKAHDNARIPIQCDSSPNAGFCPADVKPWMWVNDDHRIVNAAEQLARPSSLLSCGRIFTKFRKQHRDVFVYGDFELLNPDHSQVYTYRRFSNNKAWVLVLNFSGESVDWDILPKVKLKDWDTGN
jgi:oligo-1,6-glucosidase